jgi:hypothetical protein
MSVPGCSGNVTEIGNGDEDFCIVASASFAALAMVGNGLDGMQVCQADCDKDSDCAGSLVCHQRSKGISRVPGCRGNADDFGDGSEDFCVHPLAMVASGLETAAYSSDSSRETGIIVAVSIVSALLIGAAIVYFKLFKRPQPTKSKSGKESEDNSIDMQTAATSLSASKAQTEGVVRGTNLNEVDGQPRANPSHCGMTGLIDL